MVEIKDQTTICGGFLLLFVLSQWEAMLPDSPLWYGEPNPVSKAVDYAKFRSRSHDAAIRVYDAAGNLIATHEHKGDFERSVE
jgi:hypothetical protein